MDQQGRLPGAGATGPEVNSGIYVGGNVGALATGKHGQATQVTYGSGTGDPLEMIDRLLRKLEADAGVLAGEQGEDIVDDVQRLHTEVHSRRPRAESIRVMLSRLTSATSSTAALLATVEQIKELVSAILH
jgi:hypothetical protein